MATKKGYGKDGQVSSTLALLIGGKNTFGEVEDFKEVEFEQEVVDDRPTGLWFPNAVSFNLKTLDPAHVQSIKNGEPFILSGNINENGVNKPYQMAFTMSVTKVSKGVKDGEYVAQNIEGILNTYRETVAGDKGTVYNRDTMWLDFGDGQNVMENIATNTQ